MDLLGRLYAQRRMVLTVTNLHDDIFEYERNINEILAKANLLTIEF